MGFSISSAFMSVEPHLIVLAASRVHSSEPLEVPRNLQSSRTCRVLLKTSGTMTVFHVSLNLEEVPEEWQEHPGVGIESRCREYSGW